MSMYTREDILQMIDEEDVQFIRLQFTDMFGDLKNIAIPASKIEKAMDHKYRVDMSSFTDMYIIQEENMYLYPDLSTFSILPWRPQKGKVARLICDVYRRDGEPFTVNPRYILKKVVAKAMMMGYTLEIRPECEFFLFHTDEVGKPTTVTHERAGYLDTSPIDLGENVRRDIVLTMEDMGYEIASSHHEIASGQHEVDMEMEEALFAADQLMTFKVAVRTIAKRHGLHATFMPKPTNYVNGSGMHLNMRLFKDGKNILTGDGHQPLSDEGRAFMAGILSHIKGMTAIANPLVNSYKRLVPGFEAPTKISWSYKERTALMRVFEDREEGTYLELRSPDPSANPYLLFAYCLAAGLEGIEKKLEAPACITVSEENEMLPTSLCEALDALEADELFEAFAGKSLKKHYINAKREEWSKYLSYVSEWEIEHYLNQI